MTTNQTELEPAIGNGGQILDKHTGRPLRQRGGQREQKVAPRTDRAAKRLEARIKDYETIPSDWRNRGAYHKPGSLKK